MTFEVAPIWMQGPRIDLTTLISRQPEGRRFLKSSTRTNLWR